MASQFIIFSLILLIIGVVAVIFLLSKKNNNSSDEKLIILVEKVNQLAEVNKDLRNELDQKLSQNYKATQEQFGQTAKIITAVTEKLTKLDETNKQVISFTEQLNNLEKVLTSQKQRGNLGEAGLKLVLENILPPTSYKLQYQFPDGDTVDAVIFTKEGIIPVDAKFSLENYQKVITEKDETKRLASERDFKNDLKKRIDETSKYIKPKNGTFDFAFMFIPSEAIYYDLLVNEVGAVKVNTRSLIEYAFKERKVIIVSPTTFAAYLQTVLQGLRALKIEESAKEIRVNVEKLGKHLLAYDQFMKKLGQSLATSVNHYNGAADEFKKVDKDVLKISGEKKESEIEVLKIEKPRV